MSLRCPRCSSENIRGMHHDFGDAGLREYGCLDCGLIEDRRTDDADYRDWLERWESDGQPAAAAPAAPAPAPAPEKLP
jgi:hypothetical protein